METVLARSGVFISCWVRDKVVLIDEFEHVNMAFLAKHLEKVVRLIWHEIPRSTTSQVFITLNSQIMFKIGQIANLQDGIDLSLDLLVCLLVFRTEHLLFI